MSLLHLVLQDVYSEVAGLVKEEASKEAAEGNAVAARLLPQVDRRLVKQTVMTSVYGVTMLGRSFSAVQLALCPVPYSLLK